MRLYQVVVSGDIENVKFLFQNSVNLFIIINYGQVLLYWVVNSGYIDCVCELFKWKVDLNILWDILMMLFDMVCQMNQMYIIRILFDVGVKIVEEVLKEI